MARPMYQLGTDSTIDALLDGVSWGPIFETLCSALSKAATLGYYLDVRPFCAHTAELAKLSGAEAIRFRSQHSYALTRERIAIERFNALASWAASGAEDQPERDRAAAETERRAIRREEYATQRAIEIAAEEERTAHEKRMKKARAEFDLANPVKGGGHAA